MKGRVVDGHLLGAKVREQGQLVDPATSAFEGTIDIDPPGRERDAPLACLTLRALCAAGVAAAPAALGDVAFSRADLFVGPTANGIAAGDFDGDGVTDLAVTVSTDGTVAVLPRHRPRGLPGTSRRRTTSPADRPRLGDRDGRRRL